MSGLAERARRCANRLRGNMKTRPAVPGIIALIGLILLAACAAPTVPVGTRAANSPIATTAPLTVVAHASTLTPALPPTDTATFTPSPTLTPLPTASTSQTPKPTATFPANIYPSPQPFLAPVAGLSAGGCPALGGVEQADQLPSAEALAIIRQLRSGNSESALLVSDQTFWSSLGPEAMPSDLVQSDWIEIHRATETPYQGLISTACGQKTLELSWWVQACLGPCRTSSPALTSHYYLIKRQGHWLIWARYP